MAQSVDPVAISAALARPRVAVDVTIRPGHRFRGRAPGPKGRGVGVRRFCRSDCGRRLLELVRPSLGTESTVALGPANPVRRDYRCDCCSVLCARTHHRLSEADGGPLRIGRYPGHARAPRGAFGRALNDSGRPAQTWSRLIEILRVCLDARNLSRCIVAALIVGTILFFINQADVVFGGRATAATWVKIGLSYLVPFFVANYGIVLAIRRSGSR